jgi:5-methylcytosine-specific restriction protein B
MVAVRWIEKHRDGWHLTSDGRQALDDFPDPEEFGVELARLYTLERARRKERGEFKALAYEIVRAAVGTLEPGQWTTYTDLADLSGATPAAIGRFTNTVPMDGGHRVLGVGGRTGPDFRWPEPRQESHREALESEGLVFDETGRADEAAHVRAGDLREVLEDSGLLKATPRRAWLVRGSSVNGRDLVPIWREKGTVSLAASKLREVEAGIDRDGLKILVAEDYSQTSYAAKAAKVDEFHAFLTRMQVGDVVATTSQGQLYVGTIAGPAAYVKSKDGRSNLRRPVDWADSDGVAYQELPSEVSARLQVQYDVVEMSQQLDQLEPLLTRGEPEPEPVPVREVVLADATDELAQGLHVDRAWLQECVELLRDRPQLIFYGPPGTGKTYIAQHLAKHLAGDNVRLVQFHPAYSYEDFFEGYRPEEGGGFALKPGPMRKVVDQANDNPTTPYFLIIDEINRGNLAKIFGELYFLLEYRDQNVDLLYASNDDVGFTLPKNVFVIGTMNTADRSIALVDAAMRRRFSFVALHPSEEPTSQVLRRWLAAEGHEPLTADLLDSLNKRIEDPDFKVGPSYFMRAAVHEDGGIERVWRTAILPLLEEHHYGDEVDVKKRYGLAEIRARLAPPVDLAGAADEGVDVGDADPA